MNYELASHDTITQQLKNVELVKMLPPELVSGMAWQTDCAS